MFKSLKKTSKIVLQSYKVAEAFLLILVIVFIILNDK
ncbi:hypothetical protein C8P67_11194 [Flavobacterium aquicola]|uniref:Uncharacterized protein n=1 Tax=Flavobacterium aquicola TaxID=1682742 RepID=A0A3E0ECZ9_9FLAO|nr:hypothetical protein C8P67_11194 [Flavobacterium aquicola]